MRAKKMAMELPSRFLPEAALWVDELRARNLSPYTIELACRALRQLDLFLDVRGVTKGCCKVSKADLAAWIKSRLQAGKSPAYTENAASPVAAFYHWLNKRGHIFEDPSEGLARPPVIRRLQTVPTEGEIGCLLASIPLRGPINIRDKAIIETAYATGLRLSELAGLDLDSVDLENATVRVIGKGLRERAVPLTQAAVMMIRLYLSGARTELLRGRKDQPALWLNFRGGHRVGAQGIQMMVNLRGKEAGLQLTPHCLRRAFATHLLNHGAGPADLKLLLGHATYKHLKYYLRYAPEALRSQHRKSNLGR